jgi:hypothetical protein
MISAGAPKEMVKRLWIACQIALLLITLLPCAARAQGYLSPTDAGASVLGARTNDEIAFLPQAPSASKQQQDAQSKAQQQKKIEEKEQSQRTLGIVPRFGTTNRMDAPPLSPGEKFHLFAKTAFDPVTVVIAAAQAGVSQADNQFKGYGQGAGGYGKRFGAAFADQVSTGFFSNFMYPTLFKQDPRYFRKGHGGFPRRFVYSLKQELICHTDNWGRAFNASNILGAFSSGALSNAYYPSDDRGFKLTMSRSGLAVAYATAGNLLNEFWPDISHKLHKSKPDSPPPATTKSSADSK